MNAKTQEEITMKPTDVEFESFVDEMNDKAEKLNVWKCRAGFIKSENDKNRNCFNCGEFNNCRDDALKWLKELEKTLTKWGM